MINCLNIEQENVHLSFYEIEIHNYRSISWKLKELYIDDITMFYGIIS